ncbi:hypothetical protein [Bacillus cereus]|uniref:hypothetical protein n=1 Tax=Bacillus cereus TaxID=1396 RepID=UPI000BF796AF|nr:hypothetical protein [Bacillus cereus]PFT36098.1 hypothetical protein COK71_09815 [Bacillus cereus]
MITTIPNVNGELILSKDENSYEKVLNDFPNASYITIVTYNISASRNILLNRLRELDAEKDVTIVFKIKNR